MVLFAFSVLVLFTLLLLYSFFPLKQSLFHVAKNYVELKDDTAPISIEQYNTENDEAMKRMDAGEFYTHEQVVEMSKDWLNGK